MTVTCHAVRQRSEVAGGEPARARRRWLFFGGAAVSTLAFFPREASPRRRGRRRHGCRAARRAQDQRVGARALHGDAQPRVPLVIADRGREGADREVQRLPVSGRAASRYMAVQADPGEVRSARNPAPCASCMKDFPLEPECNDTMQHDAASGGVRGGRGRAARARARAAARRWRSGCSPTRRMTPQSVRQAARDIGTGHRLRRAIRVDARRGQGRHRARPAARGQLDADVLHQRREDRGRAGAAVLRSGDRATSCERADDRSRRRRDHAGTGHLTS